MNSCFLKSFLDRVLRVRILPSRSEACERDDAAEAIPPGSKGRSRTAAMIFCCPRAAPATAFVFDRPHESMDHFASAVDE
jgi:hypothetical protein